MKIYKKLVRDNIPDIIAKDNKNAEFISLDDATFLVALKEKLVEEAREAVQAQDKAAMIQELADLQEVMDKIKEKYLITSSEVKLKCLNIFLK